MALNTNVKSQFIYFILPFGLILICYLYLSGINKPAEISQPSPIHIVKRYNLPSELTETSGIIFFNNLIWSFNDSGGEPELYAWSEKDSSLVKRVTLWNAYNYDWEDIAQDSTYIYIGDIGNNFGSRGNLCIYRITKKNLLKSGNQAVKADRITFTYPGYRPASYFSFDLSSFDCEAIICYNDSVYLFSKDWNSGHSIVYSIPSKPGNYLANKICEFNSDGLITAADFDGKQLVLLGYKEFKVFLWVFPAISSINLNREIGKRIALIELGGAQTEGIAIKNSDTIFISNERSTINQSLWVIKLK